MQRQITRRNMIGASVLLIGSACICQHAHGDATARSTNCLTPDIEPESLAFGDKSLTIDLARTPSLSNVGTAVNVSNRARSIDLVVVQAEKDKYHALSRFCTHAGRTLSYIRTRRVLMCTNANHSIFGLDGTVVKGPAEHPLTVYPVVLKNGKLEITLQPEPAGR
jgi:nitrite reductase/ring-hydroxylating ferredoxin subunit